MSLPPLAEIEHADWPALQRMCEALGLNPKGRSAIVRMRVMDHVRRRVRAEPWRAGRDRQAALLTRLGFPDLAQRLWESTIRLDAPAPWVGLGDAQLAGGLLPEASKSFVRAVQMGDEGAELHLAEALAASGDLDRAVQACDSYLAGHPRDVRALAMKAGFLSRAGFVDEAAKALRVAADAHPDIPGLRRTLGAALLKAARYEPAAEAFRDAAERDTRDVSARVNRAAALLLGGRTRESIALGREALEIDGQRPEAANNLGVAHLRMGQLRSAVRDLERAARLFESPRILLNLAKVAEDSLDPQGATRAYEQVLRLRPNDPVALAGRKRLAAIAKERPAPTTGEGEPEAGPKTTRKTSVRREPKARRTRRP